MQAAPHFNPISEWVVRLVGRSFELAQLRALQAWSIYLMATQPTHFLKKFNLCLHQYDMRHSSVAFVGWVSIRKILAYNRSKARLARNRTAYRCPGLDTMQCNLQNPIAPHIVYLINTCALKHILSIGMNREQRQCNHTSKEVSSVGRVPLCLHQIYQDVLRLPLQQQQNQPRTNL